MILIFGGDLKFVDFCGCGFDCLLLVGSFMPYYF